MAASCRILRRASSSIVAASLLLACGGQGAAPISAEGPTAAPDGGAGALVDAGGDSAADAGPSGPSVKMVNLSWSSTGRGTTANFVLHNETDVQIESIEVIELQFEQDPQPTVFNIDFVTAGLDSTTCHDWMIPPGKSSGVIELAMTTVQQECSAGLTTCTNWWLLDVPCDTGQSRYLRNVFPTNVVRSRPDSFPLTVRLRGLMADGAQWSAKATGPLRN